jgi:hypothetical protein
MIIKKTGIWGLLNKGINDRGKRKINIFMLSVKCQDVMS